MLVISEIKDDSKEIWNKFVHSHQEATFAHLYEWKNVFEESYNLKSCYLGAFENDQLVAVFPIVFFPQIFHRLIGFSLPYLSYASYLIQPQVDEKEFLNSIINYLAIKKITGIKFRRISSREDVSTGEYTMKVMLHDNFEKLFTELKPRLRNKIKNAEKNQLKIKWSVDQVKDFYKVYSRNMLNLGTPVHSYNFFESICRNFKENVNILTLRKDNKIIAAMFVFHFNSFLTDPWTSSLKEYLPLKPNILLYWEAIKYGCVNGYKEFDFGRSYVDSGTYEFKLQWGAIPTKLEYCFIPFEERKQKSDGLNYRGYKARIFSDLWKILPYPVTLLLGPKLRKYLP